MSECRADALAAAMRSSAGLSHGFIDACRDANVRFAVGFDLTEPVRIACLSVPERRWRPAVTADGADERDGAEVAELTDLVDLSAWPAGTRAIVRREEPHPGAQMTFTDIDGHRFQVFITDLTDPDIAYLEALQRGEAAPRSSSATSKTPACASCPPPSSRSTRRGSPSRSSPMTCSRGRG